MRIIGDHMRGIGRRRCYFMHREAVSIWPAKVSSCGAILFRKHPSAHLLSGSYGLAEGTSTNGDTAVLTMGIVLSGSYGGGYWSDSTESPRNQGTYGFLSMRTLIRREMSGQLRVTRNYLKTDELNDSKHGLSACCDFKSFVNLLSQEAMGWPRGIRQMQIRQL